MRHESEILILNLFFGLNGLNWAQAAADYFSIILGLAICIYTIRKWKPADKVSTDMPR